MYYITRRKLSGTNETNVLHTIILKKIYDDTTYISAIGYGGGGVFEEFCGKFFWDDDEEGLVGFFSHLHDPDEWEKKSFETDVVDEPFELISDKDKEVIKQMTQEIWDEFLDYDEESETRLIKEKFISKLDDDVVTSDDWDVDVVDFVSNNFWGLTLRFDW